MQAEGLLWATEPVPWKTDGGPSIGKCSIRQALTVHADCTSINLCSRLRRLGPTFVDEQLYRSARARGAALISLVRMVDGSAIYRSFDGDDDAAR